VRRKAASCNGRGLKISVATQIFIPIPYPRSVFFPSRTLDPEATNNNPSIVIFKKSVQFTVTLQAQPGSGHKFNKILNEKKNI
jgi:hypothetical protein